MTRPGLEGAGLYPGEETPAFNKGERFCFFQIKYIKFFPDDKEAMWETSISNNITSRPG